MNDATRDNSDKRPETDAERETLLAAYALGGVTTEESAWAHEFIADDADAARLYAEYAAIAATLPEVCADALPASAVPSAALKDRVLAAARAEMHGEATSTPARATDDRPAPISIADARARKPFALPAGWLVAAALLIAVLGLGTWNLSLRHGIQRANRDRDIVRFAASASHAYTMTGTQSAPNANATIIESPTEGGKVVLLANGFPNARAGQTYRIWLQKQDGSYWDVGTFGGGPEQTTLVLPGNLNGVHAVVITAEPETKPAAQPTGTPVMEGTLAA